MDKISDMDLVYKLTRSDDRIEFRHLIFTLVDRRYNDETVLKLCWQSDDNHIDREPHERWYGCHVDLVYNSQHSIEGLTSTIKLLRFVLPKEWHNQAFTYIDPAVIIYHVRNKGVLRAYHDPRVGYAVTEAELAPKDGYTTFESVSPWSGHRVVTENEARAKIALVGVANDIMAGRYNGYRYISTSDFESWVENGMPVLPRPELDYRAPNIKSIEDMLDVSSKLEIYA